MFVLVICIDILAIVLFFRESGLTVTVSKKASVDVTQSP